MKPARFKYHKLSWLKMPFWLCTSGNIFFKETYSQCNNPSLNLILKLFAFVEVICSTQGGVFSTQLTNRMPAWLGYSRNFVNLFHFTFARQHFNWQFTLSLYSKLKLLKRTLSDQTMKWMFFFSSSSKVERPRVSLTVLDGNFDARPNNNGKKKLWRLFIMLGTDLINNSATCHYTIWAVAASKS